MRNLRDLLKMCVNAREKEIVRSLWRDRKTAAGGTYTYIAFASDEIGTDFSLINDTDLTYMAILESPVVIATPVVGDFVGLWRSGFVEDTAIKIAFDFITSDELFFTYCCPVAMIFTSQESEFGDAIITPALNTNLAQYDRVTITALETGMIILNGHTL